VFDDRFTEGRVLRTLAEGVDGSNNGLAVTMPAKRLGEINTGTPGVVALTVTATPPGGTLIMLK
jgi:hypothetical protein